jgi:hypothetical protein
LGRCIDEFIVAAAVSGELGKVRVRSDVRQTFQPPDSCSSVIVPSWLLFTSALVMFMPYLTADVKRPCGGPRINWTKGNGRGVAGTAAVA